MAALKKQQEMLALKQAEISKQLLELHVSAHSESAPASAASSQAEQTDAGSDDASAGEDNEEDGDLGLGLGTVIDPKTKKAT